MCEFLVYCTVKKLESLVALLTFYPADVKPQSFAFITTALYILIIIVFFDIFFNQKFKQICISLHFVSLKSPIIHPYEQSPQADFDSPIPSILPVSAADERRASRIAKRSSHLRAAHPAERFVS